jgi:hypothetical protein
MGMLTIEHVHGGRREAEHGNDADGRDAASPR